MASKAINEVQNGEKVKPIILHDKEAGQDYTLEFNLESVKFADSRKFDIDDIGRQPASALEDLFFYAFRMHHRNVAREKTNKILWEKLGGLPDGFLERLIMLYNAPMEALKRAEGDDGKNAAVTVEM